ncbi:MAG: ferritin family protein [Huintestinicola sp.]
MNTPEKPVKKFTGMDSSPYPEIRVESENKALASRISELYAGKDSELTAISRYVYQSIIFKDTYAEFAEIFLTIARAEMHHLHMLGRLVFLLGGDPVFCTEHRGKSACWNGEYSVSPRDIAAAVVTDLSDEQKAYASYISLARQAGDKYVFAVLTRIALDEMIHAAALRSILAKLRQAG